MYFNKLLQYKTSVLRADCFPLNIMATLKLRNSSLQLNNLSEATKVVWQKVIFVSNGTMYLYLHKHIIILLSISYKLLTKCWTMVNL